MNAQVFYTNLLLLLSEWRGLDMFLEPFLHFCSVGVELGFGHVLHRQVDDADVLEAIAWLFEVFRKEVVCLTIAGGDSNLQELFSE